MADLEKELAKAFAKAGFSVPQYSLASIAVGVVRAWMLEEETVETVTRRMEMVRCQPTMISCPRCKGSGYHHGFGEDGRDPDWCDKCGGPGLICDPFEEARAALTALVQEPTP